MYVVSHIICNATAADSFKTEAAETITLTSPPQKEVEIIFCWANRQNENWRGCLLFKFKGCCSFQGTKPASTLFILTYKFLQGIPFSNYFGCVFTYFSHLHTCLNTNCEKVYYTSPLAVSRGNFQREHTQCFHCTFLHNTWSKRSAAIFPWCDLHNKRSASIEITVTTAVADEKQWSCFIK